MEISFGRKKTTVKKQPSTNTNVSIINSITDSTINLSTNDIILKQPHNTNEKQNNKITYSTNFFKLANNEYKFEKDNKNIIWFEGKEFVTSIGYKNYRDAIDVHIIDKYKKSLGDILRSRDSRLLENLIGNQKSTIYISEYGIFQLLSSSKLDNPIIKLFQDRLFEEILTSIKKNDIQSNQLVTNLNNIQTTFRYNNLDILCIKINEYDLWFKAKEAAEGMEYTNTDQAIRLHVLDEDKITLENLLKLRPLEFRGPINLTYNEKNSIYINESGLYSLIFSSKKDEAKAFKKFVTQTILPSIRKTGSYNVNQNIASSSTQISKPLRITPIKSFYDDHMITQFIGKNVLYIGMTDDVIEIDNLFANKYGLSGKVIDRDFKKHKKTFTNFNMIYIRECDNKDVVEKLFEDELKAKKLWRSSKINNSTQTELFITNDTYDMDYIIKLMDTLIDNNPLKSILERDQIIKQLENNQDFDIQKMTLELKLKECDVKMKELELRQHEFDLKEKELSFKFKEDNDPKYKQLELEFKLKEEISRQLELEFKLKEEDSKQLELQFKLKEEDSKLKQLELEFKLKEEDTKQKQIELDKLKFSVFNDNDDEPADIIVPLSIHPSLHNDLLKMKSIFDFTKDMRDMLPVKEVNFRCINASIKRSSIKKILEFLQVKEYRYDVRYYCFIKLKT